MWSVRERIAVFFNCAIAIALLSTSLGAHTQNGKPIFKPLHKIANRASIKDLKLYDCPKNVQCIDDISYFLDYAKLPHFGRERINSRLKQDLKFGEFIDTYIDMLKIPECKLSANIMLHALHIFNAVEIGFQNIDVNDEDEDAYQDTLKNVFLQVFNRGPKGLNKTIIEELETLKIVSTDGQNQKSIVECYFHQQAKVTNSSSSACYNTTTFVEKTFEILYHSMKAFNLMANRGVSTTFTAFDRRRINRTSKLLRNLASLQWGHVRSVCFKNPSYVISAHSVSKPCARGVSPNKTICDSSQHIRLSMSSADKLQIQCTTEVQEFPYDCDENSRINSRRHWYISTKFLSVDDPFRESICEISLEERQHHYALLFLNISVCNREKPEMNRWISSHTEDVEFHHTIHFPFIFDPAPVGATHPTPFRVTGIGLYYDELGRLALNISTIKPLNNRDCTSEVDEFKDSHRYLEFPQIPTIYKNIKL